MLRKKFFNSPIPLWRLENFLKALTHLLKSGLPIMTSLDLMKASHHGLSRSLCQQLQNKLSQGISLSTAWQQLTQEKLSSTLIFAAEQSGTLNTILEQLVHAANQQRQMRRFIWQALRYPLFLLFLTSGLLIAMCQFIIPSFAALYGSFNVKLPWFTQIVITMSSALTTHTDLILCSLLFTAAFILIISKRYSALIAHLLNMIFPYRKRHQTWQFWHTLTILLQHGINFLTAAKICHYLLPSKKQQKQFLFCLQQIQQGQKPSQVFQQRKLFSVDIQQVFILGESTGQLASLLQSYVEQEQQRLQETLDQFKTWFEPFVMCFIGGLLGIVLLALYLPMVQLGRYV